MNFTDAHVGDFAAALVDDQLDQGTRDLVLLHLGRCPGCRSDVEEQRMLKARLLALGAPGLPLGLMARLGALSHPELSHPELSQRELPQQPDLPDQPLDELRRLEPLASVAPLGAGLQMMQRPSLLRHPQRGRRMLMGAASLLLVGAGTAVAVGGDGQPGGPSSPTSTFSTSFSTPINGGPHGSGGSALPLTDPAFKAMTASFHR